MKKLLLMILATALICSSSFAGVPPAAVKKAFTAKFPSATKVSWGKEEGKEWEAAFTNEGHKLSANFAEDGTWLETERELKISELPKAVAGAAKAKFPGWVISEANKTESSKYGLVYELDLKMGLKKMDAAFKDDGTFVAE